VLGIVPYHGSGPYQCIHPGMLSIRGYRDVLAEQVPLK